MEVPRVDSAQLRPAAAQLTADTTLDLVRGDRFTATVVALHEAGEIVLATPRGSFISRGDVRLTPGQVLALEVVQAGDSPVFRVIDGAFHFDEQAFAEAVLDAVRRNASAEREAGAGSLAATARALGRAVRTAWTGDPTTATGPGTATAMRLLSAVDPGADPVAIADHLRLLVEHGGILLEPHLRAALAGRVGTAIPDQVTSDLRVILGEWLAHGLPGADDPQRQAAAHLSRELLDRQLDQALEWVRHGRFTVEVPLSESSPDRVRLVYERDPDDADTAASSRRHLVTLSFDLDGLGHVEVDVAWRATSSQVTVRVADARIQAFAAATVGVLRRAMTSRGFALEPPVIVVAPPRRPDVEAPRDPPPAGSILREVG